MTRKNEKGMWLRHGTENEKRDLGWLMNTTGALLAHVALTLVFSELTGFGALYSPWAMGLAGGVLIVIQGGLTALRRKEWFYPGALGLILLLVLFGRSRIMEGVCLFWNQVGDTWTAATGKTVQELALQLGPEEHGSCLALFSILIGAVSGLWCGGLTFSGWGILLAVGLPGGMLTGMLLLQREVSFGYLLLALLAAAFVLLSSGWGKKQQPSAILFSGIAFAAAAAIAISVVNISGVQSWAASLSDQIHEKIHAEKYETGYTTLPEGDFSDYEQSKAEGLPALIVTMDQPEGMYLRGFTAATFEDDIWLPVDNQTLAENEDLLHWLNQNEFNPAVQFEKAAALTETGRNIITVQNIGACSKYLYVPFSLCNGEYLEPENLNTDSIASDGDRIYVYTSVTGGSGMINSLLEQLQTSEDAAVLDYRKAESTYRAYVYEHYLQIPQEVSDTLTAHWNAVCASYGAPEELTVQQAQECVERFLTQCFSSEEMPEGLELPLSVAEGTSFQYATVAAMTLRYFGIPARYAEGYMITNEMAAQAEAGSSIVVDSNCARAWVEVYQDGIGWIPLDLTLNAEEDDQTESEDDQNLGAEDPEGANGNGLSSVPKEGQELEEIQSQEVQEPEPDGGDMVTIPETALWTILLIVGVLLLLILLLMLRSRMLLKRREEKFHTENRNDAVASIFADTARLLEELGFSRGNGSMRTLCKPVRERFDETYAGELEEMIDLNARAMFSSRDLTEDQRESALKFHEKTRSHLKSALKWNQRLWMKWVRGLF